MKRRKDLLQQECDAPEPAEASYSPVNTDSNKSWDTEPNFNLNLNISSPSNPRPTKETSKMDSGSKKDDKSKGGGKTGNKGAIAVDFSTILPAEKMKSKIPTFSGSQTTQTTVKNKGKPKYPHTENPSTSEIQIHGSAALSSKPNSVEGNLSQRPMEKVKTEIPLREYAKPIPELMPELTTNSANVTPNLKTKANRKDGHVKEIHLETSSKTLQLPKSPKFFNKKGDKSNISPQITNHTPMMMAKTKKTDLVNSTIPFDQQLEDVNKAQGAFTSSETSLSPKPSLLAKPTGTINNNVSGSKESLKGKYSKAISGSKTAVQSIKSLKATKGSKNSLDSKSRSQSGSRDALDSKSSSASKSSVESKDGLELKKLQRSKASPNPKLKTVFKDMHDQKTSKESNKIHQDSEKTAASKMTNSKNNHDSKSLQSSRASFDPTIITSSGSEPKMGVTNTASLANLPTSSLDMDLLGGVSFSPISRGSIKTASSAVELRLNLKSQYNQSDPSRSEQVQSDSKSTPIDLSSLRLSPVLAYQNPGSSSKHFASTSTGSNGENQKSPSSSPGNDNPSVKIQQKQGTLAPLTSSSPKTRPVVTSKTVEGLTHTSEVSAVIKRDPGISPRNTCLTRGLTFDSITKLDNNAVRKHLRSSENKVQTKEGLEISQEDKNIEKECPLGDSRRELDRLRKMEHPRDTNIISSPRATNVGEQKQKMPVHGKKNEVNCSSPLHPISSSSTHAPTKKNVKETAAKTESQRLQKLSGERKEVAVQVEVEVVERSVSTSPSLQQGPLTSSLIGSPSCQSSLSYLPPLKHVCQIEIELCSQSILPSVVPEKASSLPACLCTYSFHQNPELMSEIGQDPDVSSESIWEEENNEKNSQANKANEDGFKGQTEKPPEVLWDKQGMTWEVYGASVDLESLGTAIQSHLEMKIREKERHIRILRKSICSNNSFTRCKLKKRRRKFLGCCVKASTVMD